MKWAIAQHKYYSHSLIYFYYTHEEYDNDPSLIKEHMCVQMMSEKINTFISSNLIQLLLLFY